MHLFAGSVGEEIKTYGLPAESVASRPAHEKIIRLEEEIAKLRKEVEELKRAFDEFKSQF
jgi:uncharacterized protein YceH (UPF0502 family)